MFSLEKSIDLWHSLTLRIVLRVLTKDVHDLSPGARAEFRGHNDSADSS